MHDGMPCDPIQGQGQGHGVCEVPKIALFQLYLVMAVILRYFIDFW